MNSCMEKINTLRSEILKRVKDRYIFLILLTVIIVFFTYVYKDARYKMVYDSNVEATEQSVKSLLKQDIYIEHESPIEIAISLGKNLGNKSSKYFIKVYNQEQLVTETEINKSEIENQIGLSILLPRLNEVKGKYLTLEIEAESDLDSDGLLVKTYADDENSMLIDGENVNSSLGVSVGYSRFSLVYLILIMLLYISACALVLFINIKKIHNTIFVVIILLGGFSAVFNPIVNSPDENAHLARTELTSRGTLFLSGDSSNYRVSDSVYKLIRNQFKTFEDSELLERGNNFEYIYEYNNFANTNIFISYIPQAMGMIIAKILGLGIVFISIFGRMFNVVFYALLVRYALKMAPIFKNTLAVMSIMPMSIFIAASFNPDTMTYGLTFLLIAYFLKMYKEEDINIKKIGIFTLISICLGVVKLPYCILGGLILFIPKDKFKNNSTYYKTFIFVALVALVSLTWGLSALISSTGDNPFSEYYVENRIGVKDQIMYILHNPRMFFIYFSKALFDNFRQYTDQLMTFGWLSYSLNGTLRLFYTVFACMVVFTYPTEEVLCKKTKIGIGLVSIVVYIITNLILYLSWTPVGSIGIEGVQGRYFCSLIALAALISNRTLKDIDERDKFNNRYIFIAIIFVVLYLVAMFNKYY